MDPKAKAPTFRDSKLKGEEACGNIECRVISNDGQAANYVLLTALKNIFQKQLPKMPREYITRLIYDRSHKSLLILRPATAEEQKKLNFDSEDEGVLDAEVRKVLKMVVVGGITYKGFFDRGFIEIVFCAISSTEQVKGYGSYLMNHMKEQAKKEGPLVQHFLTYADNYAVGYFQKQGYTKDITLDRSVWAGYIKDYDGGTLMQCTMVPGIDYLNVYSQLYGQKLALLRVIDSRLGCARVFPGLTLSKEGQARKPTEIPGVVEAGWSEELAQLAKALASQTSAQDHRTRLYLVLKPLLKDLVHHPASWPFRKPVDPTEVPDYLSVITAPMDLATMSKRLESEHYKSIAEFTTDLKLIADNCRKYNDPDTTYYKNANILENFYFEKLKVRELK